MAHQATGFVAKISFTDSKDKYGAEEDGEADYSDTGRNGAHEQLPSVCLDELCCRGGRLPKSYGLLRVQANSKWFIEWDERAKNQVEWRDLQHICFAKEGAKLVA